MPKPITIKPADGGALINIASHENVGAENYTVKWNFRRFHDREVLREGWGEFRRSAAGSALVPDGDITLIAEATRANGDRMLIAATATTIYRNTDAGWVQMGTGYATTGRRWEAAPVNGYLVLNNAADLPLTISVGDTEPQPIWELRERGIASVGTIAEYYGFLHCFDITEIVDLNAWMNGATPYGRVTAPVNRFRYKHIWSEYGQPRNWAPIFSVTMAAAGSVLTLPFPSKTFAANATRVAVVGGGVNGGTLGGGPGIETGVLVTAVAGPQITLEVPTASGITYPRTVRVTRFADVSTIVGSQDIIDDGSAILKARVLRDVLVLYRETGAFVGRYTAVVEKPFTFKRAYTGGNVPNYPDTLCDIRGELHIYASKSRAGESRFFSFDGVDEPKIYTPLDLARARFFASATRAAFAQHNSATREIWFCAASTVLALDYEQNTASEVDCGVTALAGIESADGVLLSTRQDGAPKLAQYGRAWKAGVLSQTYQRFGATVTAEIKAGLCSFGNEADEKTVYGITPLLSSMQESPGAVQIHFDLFSTPIPSRPSQSWGSTDITNINEVAMVPCYHSAIYFTDRITVRTSEDVQVHFSGRTIEVAGAGAGQIERTRQ